MRVLKAGSRYLLGLVLAVAAVGSAFATTNYSIPEDDIAALLNEAFYDGDPGLIGSTPTGALRWAYLAAINNAGTRVAFSGLTFNESFVPFSSRLYVVNVGDPSSWRVIHPNYGPRLLTPVWSPDDQYIAFGSDRIHVDSGVVEGSYYVFPDPLGLNLSNAGTGLVVGHEFDTDGDLEGWLVFQGVTNLVVSGGSIQGTISGGNGSPFIYVGGLAIDTTVVQYVVLRMKVNSDIQSSANFYWEHVGDPAAGGTLRSFKLGPAGQWRTYVIDVGADVNWNTGPGVHTIGVNPTSGGANGSFEIDFVRAFSGSGLSAYPRVGISDEGSVDSFVDVGAVSVKQSGNFAAAFDSNLTFDAFVFPVSNSLAPLTSSPKMVTNFPGSTVDVRFGSLSGDATMLTFVDFTASSQPNFSLPGYDSWHGDIYVLEGILEILVGATNPPTSLADPRVHAIRTEAEGGSNYKTIPLISPDKSIVVYTEDFNNQYQNQNDGVGAFIRSDYDIMLSTPLGDDGPPVDSANTSDDRRFANSGNQFISGATKNGLRLIWQEQDSISEPLKIYIATFVQTTTIDAETDPLPPGPTVVEGETVVLTDSAVVATQEVSVADASGTNIVIPDGQIINFPEGSGATGITIATPTAPVEQAQLPPDSEITAIPVQRTFGPVGTYFYPPVAITITYLDAEISAGDEDTIVPYLYNEFTGIFDIPVPESDIISRDPANNSITFLVDHFSTYALAISNPEQALSGLPAASGAGLVVLSGLMVAAYAVKRRKR